MDEKKLELYEKMLKESRQKGLERFKKIGPEKYRDAVEYCKYFNYNFTPREATYLRSVISDIINHEHEGWQRYHEGGKEPGDSRTQEGMIHEEALWRMFFDLYGVNYLEYRYFYKDNPNVPLNDIRQEFFNHVKNIREHDEKDHETSLI